MQAEMHMQMVVRVVQVEQVGMVGRVVLVLLGLLVLEEGSVELVEDLTPEELLETTVLLEPQLQFQMLQEKSRH
jgi:hypothetical protein